VWRRRLACWRRGHAGVEGPGGAVEDPFRMGVPEVDAHAPQKAV
jgi:hypothetical protein